MKHEGARIAAETIAHHSHSFSLASTLLPPGAREDVWVLYHWCRRADDLIDHSRPDEQQALLDQLRAELDEIYAGRPISDPPLAAFQEAVMQHGIPRHYPDELLAGLAMDTRISIYPTTHALLKYAYRVAGTVGLMMCHVLNLRDARALQPAVDLGIAMQITNICRDVLEDWERGRLYLPLDMLRRHGAEGLEELLGGPLPEHYREPLAETIEELLALADHYYHRADAGMMALPWRAALAVRTARRVYSAIGMALRRQACDVFAGRAHVSKNGKLWLACGAVAGAAWEAPWRLLHPFRPARLCSELRFEAYIAADRAAHRGANRMGALVRPKAGMDA
jgi:phytoene synthase